MTTLSKMRTKTIAVLVTISTAAFILLFPASRADSETSQTVLRETILSLDKARNQVLEDHFRSSGGADPGYSREDALLFVAYLDGRINHYCKTLYLGGGAQSLNDLPCGTSGQGVAGGPRFDSVPEYSGQTSEEKVVSLDQELTTTLGEFDDMLLKEQERAAAHIPRQRESGSTGQYGQAAGSEQEDTDPEGNAGAAKQSPGARTAESGRGEPEGDMEQGRPTEGAGGGETDNSRTPPARGSKELSEDDDVVARQLREAAEQETDPEVKEKLWEEYRKYKEGIK
jgi:hypothetical protein